MAFTARRDSIPDPGTSEAPWRKPAPASCPGPVLGTHAEPGAATDLMEVVVQAARASADYELLAHGLEVFSGQPPPTVSHTSSSRRKSGDHPKRNPAPPQWQRSLPCLFSIIPQYEGLGRVFGVVRDGPLVQNTFVRRRRHRCKGSAARRVSSGQSSRGEQRVLASMNLVKCEPRPSSRSWSCWSWG